MNASGWANLFTEVPSQEAVFVTLHNTLTEGVPDYRKNNTWENGIRPYNARGGGGKTPSAMLVDMFPMSDGKIPATCETYNTLTKSDIPYYREFPFVDRDPRFYRTFAFQEFVGRLSVILRHKGTDTRTMVLIMNFGTIPGIRMQLM